MIIVIEDEGHGGVEWLNVFSLAWRRARCVPVLMDLLCVTWMPPRNHYPGPPPTASSSPFIPSPLRKHTHSIYHRAQASRQPRLIVSWSLSGRRRVITCYVQKPPHHDICHLPRANFCQRLTFWWYVCKGWAIARWTLAPWRRKMSQC